MESTIRPAETDPTLERRLRKWRTLFVLGLVLCCGPVLGILGTIAGMLLSLHRIETMPAPTPDDLAAGVHLGLLATALGAFAVVIGAPLALWSHRSLKRLRAERETGTWA